MKILRKLWGLFVDDGRLSAATLAWCAACAVVAPYLPAGARGPALFCGLAVAVVASVVKKAGAPAGRKKEGVLF